MKTDYNSFLASPTAKQWKKIGARRRAGVATPLFSIYSEKSIGIGEIPDLKLLVDWCRQAGLSIIQLLPLNDVGFEFRPYDAQSSMALDPMYLSLERLTGCDLKVFHDDMIFLRRQFPIDKKHVDYGIKKAKLELLWKVFQHKTTEKEAHAFTAFLKKNKGWIQDYALYKVMKEVHNYKGWMDWPLVYKVREKEALKKFLKSHKEQILFQQWLQWQLFLQMTDAKKYAAKAGVFLMGDIPFLVSRDSADVWAHQEYFKLDLSSGAPPDLYFSKGQRWGMPPYHWENIASDDYEYLIQKLQYAECFFDLYRIDHFVGMFRLWTIRLDEPSENAGMNGSFDPRDEKLWKEHGEKLLAVMLANTDMLPCAEDLGVVPKCSYEILADYKIPGSDVQRWVRHWDKDYSFKEGSGYRENSMAMLSTHDTSPFGAWWENEIGTVDEWFFKKKCYETGIDFEAVKHRLFDLESSKYGRLQWKEDLQSIDQLLDILKRNRHEAWPLVDAYLSSSRERKQYWDFLGLEGMPRRRASARLVELALQKINETDSVFSLQLLQDWLSLAEFKGFSSWDFRINVPGTMDAKNWSLMVPYSLEEMMHLTMNGMIQKIMLSSKRV